MTQAKKVSQFHRAGLCAAVILPLAWQVGARADTVNGNAIALRSNGQASGTKVFLKSDGYVGTYIHLDQATPVNFTINSQGSASNGLSPDMSISIANTGSSFGLISATAANYGYTTPTLPAGTYFVRVQMDNQTVSQNPFLFVNTLTATGTGVTIMNDTNSAPQATMALAAAQTYINNFRQGQMTVKLVDGGNNPLAAGTHAQVTLVRNGFNLGSATFDNQGGPYSLYPWMTATAGGTGNAALAYDYQQFLVKNFNITEPENAGKWSNSDGNLTAGMTYVDQLANFTEAHNMGLRMHNMLWHSQQPASVTQAFTNASAQNNSPASIMAINNLVSNRIAYYAGGNNTQPGPANGLNRTLAYTEMDVLNEGGHAPTTANSINYLANPAIGSAGMASYFSQVKAFVTAAGANTRLYTNEFNVLQSSSDPVTGASDPYANWYRTQVESINKAGFGNVVSGVGMELYANANPIDPGTMQKAIQNMAVTGQAQSLTEFGISTSATLATAEADLQNAFTMMYGNPMATTFNFWDFWQTEMQSDSFLVNFQGGAMDANGNPTALYTDVFLPMMQADGYVLPGQITLTDLTVGADGTISFNGSYGTYDVTVNGQDYLFTSTAQGNSLTLVTAAPEPATMGIMACGIGLRLRRRRRSLGSA